MSLSDGAACPPNKPPLQRKLSCSLPHNTINVDRRPQVSISLKRSYCRESRKLPLWPYALVFASTTWRNKVLSLFQGPR